LFLLSWYGWQFPDAPLSREVEALAIVPAASQLVSMFALLYLFPTGKLVSRPFARMFWLHVSALAVVAILIVLSPSPLAVSGRPSPFAALPARLAPLADNGNVLLAPFAIIGIVSLVVRWRRAGPAERAQLKWFLAGAVFCVLILMTAFFSPRLGDDSTGSPRADIALTLMVVAAFWALPATVVVAVLRYRLYDIDLIINRALVYGSLTAATVGSYVLLVFGLGWVVRTVTGQGSNQVVVALTTLVVAALFQPARRRIQSTVDRRFYRARYDATRTLEAFQARLRDETELETLRQDMVGVVRDTLQPTHATVWLREPEVSR
jgi:hypothetical protein